MTRVEPSGELRQRYGVVKKSRHKKKAELQAMSNFRDEVLRLDLGQCSGTGSGTLCDGPVSAHHCIRQQTLRAHISTLELTDEERWDWIWAPDVGTLLCDRHHSRHHSRMEQVPLEWIPARVCDWTKDRDVFHLLIREHPSLSDPLDF